MATDQPAWAINAIDGASPYTLARLKKQDGAAPYDFSRLLLIDDVRTPGEAGRILELVSSGAVLVCCRAMPERWTALQPAADSAGDIARLQAGFRKAVDQGKVVDARSQGWQEALDEAQTVRWTPASAKLSFQHRRVQGGEIYFLTNWGEGFSGEVYEMADVWLNGRRVGTSWFAPHGLDLTGHVQPGRNQLRIDVPNILKNHLEPGEYTRPSGLLGSIRVRPVGRVFLQVTTP
jgi:hypothetical protein